MISESKILKILNLIGNPIYYLKRRRYLFIVSHMRSRSSLLSHILGSNEEIIGYRELHISYKNPKSLYQIKYKLFNDKIKKDPNSFLLDKILHNYRFKLNLFKKSEIKIIFLLRAPDETLKSIIKMGNEFQVYEYKSQIKALNYYIKRLKEIENLYMKFDGDKLYLDSNDLIENTEETLDNLSKWLKLKSPLKKEYLIFDKSGVQGHGDPSSRILEGSIKKEKTEIGIKLQKDISQKARENYIKCINIINRNREGFI